MAEVVVVGAGPAGLAAAIAAAEAGARVRLLDDNPAPGGQIWRKSLGKPRVRSLQRLVDRLERAAAEVSFGTTVIDAPNAGRLVANGSTGVESIPYEALVIATGARELFLPFPGWTLPGVMGAGGAQALLKSGADFEGKRIVVSGSGPLLLAVGASFARAGADVVGVFEQAPMAALLRFGLSAISLSRVTEGAGYAASLGGSPYASGTWVTEALGSDRVKAAVLTDGSRTWTEECELLACAYGLVPNTELASLLGCDVVDGKVVVSVRQATTVPGVFAAGEPVGIGGLELALAEGEVAGKAAAGVDDPSARARAAKLCGFRSVLDRAFTPRPETLQLGLSETILCRCEDVRLGAIDPNWTPREAKLYTRLGMGPCQGRICGSAARCLFGWEPDRVRPPLYPTEVNLVAACERAN